MHVDLYNNYNSSHFCAKNTALYVRIFLACKPFHISPFSEAQKVMKFPYSNKQTFDLFRIEKRLLVQFRAMSCFLYIVAT